MALAAFVLHRLAVFHDHLQHVLILDLDVVQVLGLVRRHGRLFGVPRARRLGVEEARNVDVLRGGLGLLHFRRRLCGEELVGGFVCFEPELRLEVETLGRREELSVAHALVGAMGGLGGLDLLLAAHFDPIVGGDFLVPRVAAGLT